MIPNISLWKGLEYPEIPDCLKCLLNCDERLVSPRIPFMRIKRLGYEKQYGIKGAVVNVPISIENTTRVLPRNLDDTYTIQFHLRRKMPYKHDFLSETI